MIELLTLVLSGLALTIFVAAACVKAQRYGDAVCVVLAGLASPFLAILVVTSLPGCNGGGCFDVSVIAFAITAIATPTACAFAVWWKPRQKSPD